MLLKPLHGSPLLVFSLLRPLVLLTLVARSFCTATVFDRAKDRRSSDPAVTVRESFVSLGLLFREFCVLDVWRHLHPDLHAYTGLNPDGSLSPRIDFIGFPSTWPHLVSSCSLVPRPFSDHDAVYLASLSLNLFLLALADGK